MTFKINTLNSYVFALLINLFQKFIQLNIVLFQNKPTYMLKYNLHLITK